MARQTRPVHIQVLTRGDYIEVDGFGDCKVLKAVTHLSEILDVACIWTVSPRSQLINICTRPDSLVSLVELVTDDNPDVEETTQTILPIALRRGDTFYFGRHRVTSLDSGVKHPDMVNFVTDSGMTHRVCVRPTMRLRRVVTTRKAKPLSFTEFALSSYEKALSRLVEAVSRYQMDPARVEVQKPAKKAENASSVITTKDVPSPAPVEPCNEDCDRSYCLDSMESKAGPDRVLTCSDVIAELEEVRQHEGDLPVSIVNPEDGFRRVNVSGSMLEDLYECGETYWGSRTWDTQLRPGHSNRSDLVVTLW